MKVFYFKLKYRLLFYFPVIISRFFLKNKNKIKTPHFFILGSGRNGSTLLATVLNAHKDIVIPPEQFILPYAIIRKYLLFFWSSKLWVNNIISLFNINKKTTNWNINLDNLASKHISNLFNEIFIRFKISRKLNAKYWGDKSPLNTNFIRYIYPEFPTAKYIFLIRDPRDVMLSYRKYLGPKSSYQNFSLWKWHDSIKTLEYLQKRTNVLIVRYEDFVLNTNNELNRIQSFLEIEILDNLSESKQNISSMGVSEMDHHQNLHNPISTNSVGKWKSELPKEDLRYFKSSISRKMTKFKY